MNDMHGTFEYAQLLIPIYNNLYDRAQALLKRFNPCNVCDGVCERFRRGGGRNFCCDGCVYLGPKGCRVKSLRCALWICDKDLIHENNIRAFQTEMWNILITADQFKLLVPRGSMEDSIAQACDHYARSKGQHREMVEIARNYTPAPLFFDNALLKQPETFYGTNSFRAWRTPYSEAKTKPIEKSDVSETPKEG